MALLTHTWSLWDIGCPQRSGSHSGAQCHVMFLFYGHGTYLTYLLLFCTVPYCLQANRARLAAAVQQSMQHSVHHWAVAQVCDWADYIGLGQYRKKFVHHCIDGRLLLSLTHKDLKVPHTLPPSMHALLCCMPCVQSVMQYHFKGCWHL